ncbi:MAG: type II CRISPR RNA-guided endonuclease Cas9 [Pirellulales bacterium]|nr:type II CRISPR RNA-guided endonuclease Cas9 [Pirellulales bacterium]
MGRATLGLDLGSNSIGWALVDEQDQRIIASGVRIFPEGVDRDTKGAELSKNAARRLARAARRQTARRARRRRKVRDLLRTLGFLPEGDEPSAALDGLSPWTLRRRALDEALSPHELGRVFVHLAQRRGFKSNRKVDRDDRDESKLKEEIKSLDEEIIAARHRTVGEHFAALLANDPLAPVRGRHTDRAMYEHEFELIWQAQARLQPDRLNDDLKQQIHRAIYFQRDIYWPATSIGHCELEPGQRRCPRADRAAQRFRLLQEVNNLRVLVGGRIERQLTAEERDKALAYLVARKDSSFDDLRRKSLGLLDNDLFNLEAGGRKSLWGMPTDSTLANKKYFGSSWHKRPSAERDAIVRALIDLNRDDDKLRERALSDWGLDAEHAESLLSVANKLPQGYASFSRKAIEKLLPHLERGLLLMTDDGTPSAMSEAGYLRPDQRQIKVLDRLPSPPKVTNPIVRQGLFEARKLVNAIIKEYGKPAAIHIELAREVQGGLQERADRARDMRQREERRKKIAEQIEAAGFKPTGSTIKKWLLWEEQERICLYTGEPISQVQLLNGEVDVDHILPYSRSLDNSMANKALCFVKANRDKGDRTPHEWLAETDPERFEQVLQRARVFNFHKRRKFVVKEILLDNFIERQLNDTKYISRVVAQYVRCLGTDVVTTKGQVTADLRHAWGLDKVLRDDGVNRKNREDHRHHAVDAIVVALTTRSHLQRLAGCRDRMALKEPWEGFRVAVVSVVNAIYVSHRVRRKVRGALHEDTIYGPVFENGEQVAGRFVYRKALTALTPAMVPQIRDGVIRELVLARLAQHGIDPAAAAKIPQEVWREPLRMPSGVQIKKVRLLKTEGSVVPLRGELAFVKPGDVHHVMIFEHKDSKGQRRRIAEFVSLLEASQRVRDKRPLIDRSHADFPDASFVMSLSADECVLINHAGAMELYRFKTGASTSKQMWFQHHTAGGRGADKLMVISKMPATLDGRKVTVDLLGRIRWAND